jgi:hypothetical protein
MAQRQLDPNMRQAPSGRRRGVGGEGGNPLPVVLQRLAVGATPDIEYTNTGTVLTRIEAVGGSIAEMGFAGVQQNAQGQVALVVDFRMQAFGVTGALPYVEVQADLGDGGGFIPIPNMRTRRNCNQTAGTGTNEQQFALKGRLPVAEGKTSIKVRAMWHSGSDAFLIKSEDAAAPATSFTAPGGWFLESEIVQYVSFNAPIIP